MVNGEKESDETLEIKAIENNLNDEFCENEIYNRNVAKDDENLVEEILVTPEGEVVWNEDTFKELLKKKLESICIITTRIEIRRSDDKTFKAFVKIEAAKTEKVDQAMFHLKVIGWKMEIM